MHKRQTGLLLVYIYTHIYIYICSLPLFLSLSLLFLLCRGKTSQRLAIWNVSSTKKWGAFGPKSPFRLIKGWRCHKTLRKKHGQMQQIQQPTSVCSDGEDIFNHGLGCGVRPTPGLNPVEHVNPYIKNAIFVVKTSPTLHLCIKVDPRWFLDTCSPQNAGARWSTPTVWDPHHPTSYIHITRKGSTQWVCPENKKQIPTQETAPMEMVIAKLYPPSSNLTWNSKAAMVYKWDAPKSTGFIISFSFPIIISCLGTPCYTPFPHIPKLDTGD